ncbi:MAG: stage III sporulation protein AD [Bacillota bacterium]|jgi:stage III sporulation protein AD|nr:stage III sporulation protein AD [Bacillota bacterium]HOB91260.1 stage III sporulation protein AD [Bacillota bacterium]HPZ53665.1 stage III sporulation protein AD [Bacillota bacterium]HQD17226.1 stage III sporulation protein AD [Bacillota bacterium]
MNILSLAGLAIVGLLVLALARQVVPEMATLITIGLGVVLLALVVDSLGDAVDVLQGLAGNAGIKSDYIRVVLKVVGVSYITAFAAQMCRDAGESALAAKVELAGKVMILLTALPVFKALAEAIEGLATMAL